MSYGSRPSAFGARADVGDDLAHVVAELAVDEDALGVRGGECAPAFRGARLVQHRRALRRRLRQVDRVHLVVLAVVLHAMDARRIGVQPRVAIAQHGAVLPASFPELVDDLHVFLGQVVAAVVLRLLGQAHAARGAVEIAGDDVPADATLGQMVERRHAAGEGIGRLVGQVAGDAKAEIARGVGHRRHQQQRIVHRDLHRVADRGVRRVRGTRRRRRGCRRGTGRRTGRVPASARATPSGPRSV